MSKEATSRVDQGKRFTQKNGVKQAVIFALSKIFRIPNERNIFGQKRMATQFIKMFPLVTCRNNEVENKLS